MPIVPVGPAPGGSVVPSVPAPLSLVQDVLHLPSGQNVPVLTEGPFSPSFMSALHLSFSQFHLPAQTSLEGSEIPPINIPKLSPFRIS